MDKNDIFGSWKALAVILIGVVAAFVVDYRSVKQFSERFNAVKVGMNESRVVALLGAPDYQGYSFRLGQENGFEDAYKRALHSGSKKFLSWYVGMEFVFTVGIDEQGKVTIAEGGGT